MDTAAQLTPSSPWQAFSTLSSSLEAEVAAQLHVKLQGNTRGHAGLHQQRWLLTQLLPPLWGEKGKKSRWKLHVSCQLDLTADQERGERKLSLLVDLPQKGGLCSVQGPACSPSVPCLGAVTVLQATAAPGSGLAPSRPADASSSSSPGWPSCMEHRHCSQSW